MNIQKLNILLKPETIFSCVLILGFGMYLWISQYTYPVADDLYYTLQGKSTNLWDALIDEYLHWNGRYISNIFVILNPMVWDSLEWYKITPIIIISLTCIGLYLFIRSVTSGKLNKMLSLLTSGTITLLFLHKMPILSEGIYWYTGAVTYQLSLIFLLILLKFVIDICSEKLALKYGSVHVAIIIVLLFMVIGFNEVTMLISLFVLLCFWYYSKKHSLKHSKLFFYLFITALTFSLFMTLAPGNTHRTSLFSENHNIVYSFIMSIIQVFRFCLDWMQSLALICLSILYIPLNRHLSKQAFLFKNSFFLTPLHAVFILFLLVFICVFPAYWGTGILGQHRTMNVAFFVFLIMWFINLTVWYNYFKGLTDVILPKAFFNLLVVLISGSLIFSNNSYNLAIDILKGTAQNYDNQMKNRMIMLESKIDDDNQIVYIPKIHNPPKTIFVLDISEDSTYWVNDSYSAYLGEPNKLVAIKR